MDDAEVSREKNSTCESEMYSQKPSDTFVVSMEAEVPREIDELMSATT